MDPENDLKAGFDHIDRVVADHLRFKRKLGIGEDAYASLRLKKNLIKLWDLGSWAGTGAAVASSQTVATTFFASKGFLAFIGFGTAVTPVGWVVAAAVGSAGAYYGVTRLFGRFSGSRIETIPKFINTPIDLLGASLMDMMGALAVRIALIDGHFDKTEREAIAEHFVSEWGFDQAYVEQALEVFIADAGLMNIKCLAHQLADFQTSNPDCNAPAMQSQLLEFLKEIAAADGVLDEREELALDAVEAALRVRKTSFLKHLLPRVPELGEKALTRVRRASRMIRPKPFSGKMID
ncbi:Tellurite resistance protein TerB [Sphingobium faniae]|nr:Tellurite resistance protein TerB [Sphingobium faniae]